MDLPTMGIIAWLLILSFIVIACWMETRKYKAFVDFYRSKPRKEDDDDF